MKNFKLISKIALTIIKNTHFDDQMNSIIEIIGQYTQVSRAYIFVDNNKNMTTSNIFEWCNAEIDSQIELFQELPYKTIPSWRQILLKEGMIYSKNTMELPEDIRAILESHNILSILVYPLYISNEIRGFIGFDECKVHREWNEANLNLITTISGIVSNLYEKHLSLKEIAEDKNNFNNFFKTMDDFVIIANLNGEILFANDSTIKKLGYSMEELLKMKIIELYPTNKRKEALKILNSMFSGNQKISLLELVKKDGTIIPVETRIWFGKWDNQECIFGLSKNLSKEQEALQKFTKLFDNNPALMAVSSIPEMKIIDVNLAFIKKLGYSYDELIGKTNIELKIIDIQENIKLYEQLKKTGKIQNTELKAKSKSNHILDGLLSGEIIKNQGKEYFLTVMVDITKQKNLQKMYDNERRRLRSIIKGSNLGTWEWNIKTGELIFNKKWAEIIGYELAELEPITIKTWEESVHPKDLKKSNILLEKHFKGEIEYYDIECRMKHKNGTWIWVYDRGKVIEWEENGNPLKMFGTHSDISEKKEIENKLLEISIRDPLTNIYNRRYIYERLTKDIERFKRKKIMFSISIIDIDFFKKINDNYGHLAGDYILKKFTSTLSKNLRKYDLLGRYGGEEFIIVTYDADKENTTGQIQKILEIIRKKEFKYDNDNIKMTFSCGVSDISELHHKNIEIKEIVEKADQRLYSAKKSGRNQIIFTENKE